MSCDSVAIWAQVVMAQFATLPRSGHYEIDLDEVPSDPDEFAAGDFEEPSEGETIPGSPAQLKNPIEIVEVVDSDSEVEVVNVATVLSLSEEQLRMKSEERYGHLHRVEVEQERVEDRVKRVVEATNEETAEQRRVRRRHVQKQIVGRICLR